MKWKKSGRDNWIWIFQHKKNYVVLNVSENEMKFILCLFQQYSTFNYRKMTTLFNTQKKRFRIQGEKKFVEPFPFNTHSMNSTLHFPKWIPHLSPLWPPTAIQIKYRAKSANFYGWHILKSLWLFFCLLKKIFCTFFCWI